MAKLGLSAVAAASLVAQGTGLSTADLFGRATDALGRPLVGVRILLVQEDTGLQRRLETDARGQYRFRLLPTGRYRLRAEAEGRSPQVRHGLWLHLGSAQQMDLRFPEAAQATVVVEAEAPETQRFQVSAGLGRRQLDALPMDRRSFTDLSLATPLAVVARGPVDAGAPDSGLSLAGASPRQNNFRVDGLDNNDLGNGNIRFSFSQEAIQEFQVVAGLGNIEQGRGLGGILNAITRSGSNRFEGSLYTFFRPGNLDARSPLGPGNEEFRQLQTGATFGGPIQKDRLFYFVALERFRRQDQKVVAIDPLVAQVAGLSGFQIGLGGQPGEATQGSLFGRLDWIPTGSHRLTFTLAQSDEHVDDQIPWGGLVARSAGARRDTRNLSTTLSHQWLPNAWLSQELRVLYTTRDNRLSSLDPANTVQVEIQGSALFGTQRFTPQETSASYLQVVDVLTASLGDHTLKAGVDLLDTLNRGRVQQNFSGYYLFTAIPAVGIPSSFAAFAAPNPFGGTGIPSAFLQAFGEGTTRFRSRDLGLFLQEEWQASPRLLLTLGLRFDRTELPEFPWTSDLQAISQTPSGTDPVLGPIRLPDAPERPYSQLLSPRRDWSHQLLAPRAAFSWQLHPQWRAYGALGSSLGNMNLAPVFGSRLINGRDIQGVFRTLLDPVAQSPMIAWANADGVARDRRYVTPPAGNRVLAIPGDFGGSRMDHQNVGLEWNPAPELRVGLDLAWNQGKGLMNLRDVNPFLPGALPRRPDLRYGPVYRTDGSGESRFQGQTLSLDWKTSARFLLQAAYTHSKAQDNLTDWGATLGAQSPWDPRSEWGPSYQDQTHRIVVNAVWSSGTGGAAWSRNWSVAALVRVASGRPHSQLLGFDRTGDGDPGPDRPEGLGRNSERTPWTRQLDLRVVRQLDFPAMHLDLMVDVFNVFNTANILEVQNILSTVQPPYGSPTRFGPMRQLQVGAKLRF